MSESPRMTDPILKSRPPALQAFQTHFKACCAGFFEQFADQIERSGRSPCAQADVRPQSHSRLPVALEKQFLDSKSKVLSGFLEQLDDSFERLVDPARRPRKKGKLGKKAVLPDLASRISQLTLIDNEQLEHQLLVDTVVRKLRFDHGAGMAELDIRLEHILCRKINMLHNPVNPSVLIAVFVAPLQEEAFLPENIRLLVRAYVNVMTGCYGDLLAACNQGLSERGVLPDIDSDEAHFHSLELQEEEATRGKREGLLQSLLPESENRQGNASAERLYSGLLNLLATASQNGLMDRHQIQAAEQALPISDAELLQCLNELDSDELAEDGADYPDAALPELTLVEAINALVAARGKSLTQKKAGSISMVSMLFDELNRHDDLALHVKMLINRLRVPFAKAAVQDGTFFSDPENPAQDLMNLLTKAGSTWTPAAARRRDSLYNKIAAVVVRIRKEFEDDYRIFDDCFEDFDLFLHAERRRAKLIEDRLIATEKARARTDRARATAVEHIAEKFPPTLTLPDGFASFLAADWKQTLFFIFNKEESTKSVNWQEAMILEDMLLASLRRMPGIDQARLIDRLVKLLVLVGNDPEVARLRTVHVFDSLGSVHSPSNISASPLATKSSATSPSVISLSFPVVEEDVVPARHDNDARTTADSVEVESPEPADYSVSSAAPEAACSVANADMCGPDAHILIEKLAMGTWLHLVDNGQVLKVRVAAYIRPTQTFVLVNRNGSKTGQYRRDEMLQLILQGRVRVIENTMMFERSLESVINYLRQVESRA
jgi:hypothetical protein